MWVQRLPARQFDLAPFASGRRPDPDDLRAPLRAKLVRENIAQLYTMPVPSPVQ